MEKTGVPLGSVGVRIAELRKNFALARFHGLGVGLVFVVPALQVQDAMHDEMGKMRFRRLALFGRFAAHHRRAQDEVAMQARFGGVRKGKHVGRIILAAVVAVQAAAFFGIDETQRHLAAARQRGARPAPQLRPQG